MKYEVYMFTLPGSFEWILIPNDPSYVKAYSWLGAKAYAECVGLPVRERDERGAVTREFYPAVADE